MTPTQRRVLSRLAAGWSCIEPPRASWARMRTTYGDYADVGLSTLRVLRRAGLVAWQQYKGGRRWTLTPDGVEAARRNYDDRRLKP